MYLPFRISKSPGDEQRLTIGQGAEKRDCKMLSLDWGIHFSASSPKARGPLWESGWNDCRESEFSLCFLDTEGRAVAHMNSQKS